MSIQSDSGIESPCIQLCVVDSDSGFCLGCGRTRDEVGDWISMSSGERRDVMDQLPDRLSNLTLNRRRKGGARSRRQSVAVGY